MFRNQCNEGEKSWQSIIDAFIMKINSGIIILNSKLSKEMVINMNKVIKNYYELSDTKISKFLQPPKSHLLAIENTAYNSEGSKYMIPITHCTIEEMN